MVSCNNDASSKVKVENVEVSKSEAGKSKEVAVMVFEKTEHDFGDMIQGDVVETTFKFKNTGKTALVITNARASCGCTVPKYPEKPIQPGEEAEIEVKFNSRGKKGNQNKRVTLTTNTKAGKEYVRVLANVALKEDKK